LDIGIMTYHVGQKVVCIDGKFPSRKYKEAHPVEGQVYTIRALRSGVFPDGSNLTIYLKEIRNPKRLYRNGFTEVSFRIRRFRPLCTKKTDISIFTAMLNKKELAA
jgi:hypothetical protein